HQGSLPCLPSFGSHSGLYALLSSQVCLSLSPRLPKVSLMSFCVLWSASYWAGLWLISTETCSQMTNMKDGRYRHRVWPLIVMIEDNCIKEFIREPSMSPVHMWNVVRPA